MMSDTNNVTNETIDDYKSEIGQLIFWLSIIDAGPPPAATGKTKQVLAQLLCNKEQANQLVNILKNMNLTKDKVLVEKFAAQEREYYTTQLDIIEFRLLSGWILEGIGAPFDVSLDTKKFLLAWMSNLNDKRFNWRIDAAATVHNIASQGFATNSQDEWYELKKNDKHGAMWTKLG